MTLPVFPLLNVSIITSLLATQVDASVAIYPHGEAPQNVLAPYILWLDITERPANMLTGTPLYDDALIQVECYAKTGPEVDTLRDAVRDVIEERHDIEDMINDGRDVETKLYRRLVRFQMLHDR